jgi:hypothetical protein
MSQDLLGEIVSAGVDGLLSALILAALAFAERLLHRRCFQYILRTLGFDFLHRLAVLVQS